VYHRVPQFGDALKVIHSCGVEQVLLTDEASELTETVSSLWLVLLGGWRLLVHDPQDSDGQDFEVRSDANDERPHPQIAVGVQRESNDHPLTDTVE
jgi:hypothetical protein